MYREKNVQREINKVIVDTENITETLLSVEKIVDKDWDEEKNSFSVLLNG
ncbi:hypothetical protein [Sutcliffiella sp. FSL R7-0096]